MKLQEVGKIVNTHGLLGELRMDCWCDSVDFLLQFDSLMVGNAPYRVVSVRAQKHLALLKLEGVDSVEQAQALKNKVVCADVSGVELPEGQYFIQDLLGLTVVDDLTGAPLGVLRDVLNRPAHDVYLIQDGERERLVPAVPQFVKGIDMENGKIRMSLIEGM